MTGYVKAQRDRFEHPLFKSEKFCRGYAWDWIVARACYRPQRYDVRGKTIHLERGQFVASPDEMAAAWNWSRSAVIRFLTRLKSEHMIEQSTGHNKTVVTVCNYEEYQSQDGQAGHKSEQPTGHKSDTNRTAKEEGKEGKKVEEEDSDESSPGLPAVPADETAEAVQAYNAAAEASGWSRVQKLTAQRRAALRARLKEAGGVAGWRDALTRAAASDFLCGRAERVFFASFDFLTRQSSFVKLMEGQYDNRASRPSHTGGHRHDDSRFHHTSREIERRLASGEITLGSAKQDW